MKEKLKIFIKIVPILLLVVLTAFGDTTLPPCSYKAVSMNEKYFFVMLAPKEKKEFDCNGYSDEKKADAKKLREQFSVSGLYTKDSLKPLWAVDWYSHQLYIANDGKHIVRIGPWASNASDEAFSFIENGEIKKTYKVEDLITSIESLPHSTSHFEWKKEFEINDENQTFSTTTLENRKFVFDLKTGELISKTENGPLNNQGNSSNKSFCGGVALLFGLILLFLLGR